MRIAEANAAFAVANEKCDDLAGNAQDACRKEAATGKRDAAYAVAKEKCGSLADDARSVCIKEAKVRHGQS